MHPPSSRADVYYVPLALGFFHPGGLPQDNMEGVMTDYRPVKKEVDRTLSPKSPINVEGLGLGATQPQLRVLGMSCYCLGFRA